jgi:hypothetical protein
MTRADYKSKVNLEFCGVQAFAVWVRFSDSFPPLPAETYPKVSFYELLVDGIIRVIGIYLKPDGEGQIATMVSQLDFFKDILEDKEHHKSFYWRYLPPPPDDFWYNDSGLSKDQFLKKALAL